MRNIAELIPLAKQHDEAAMLELLARFVRKLLKVCGRYGHGWDEDMQAYLLLCFIEDVYAYTPAADFLPPQMPAKK